MSLESIIELQKKMGENYKTKVTQSKKEIETVKRGKSVNERGEGEASGIPNANCELKLTLLRTLSRHTISMSHVSTGTVKCNLKAVHMFGSKSSACYRP